VARCTTERLMRQLGLHGVRRGKKIRTTTPGKDGQRAGDLLNRDFTAPAPDRRWAAATHKRAKLVLDALQMALWRRDHDDHPAGSGLIHHSDAGSQYVSFVFTAHLIEAGIDASIGTVGDALDNALMESTIGLYKTELINKDGPWRSLADVELATAGYVDWFNHKRLHTAIGGVPPAEYEAAYYAQTQPDPEAGPNN
jgi:putative transposase